MLDDQNAPADADKAQTTPPVSGDAGQGSKDTEAPLQVPEKFQGKSPEEIAKAYQELEKKFGETSEEVASARKVMEQNDTLLRAIWSDPDLYRQVEQGVKKYTSGEVLPETKPNDKPPKGDEGSKESQVDQVADLKVASENRVLNEFAVKYGYNTLPEKERKDSYARLAVTLAELVDPGGKKSVRQILNNIPTSKLPRYLENAHFIANKDKFLEKAKDSGRVSHLENQEGSIGSFAASSGKAKTGVELTSREREVAQKMGVSEENYAKRKSQMLSETKRFES